MSEPKKPLAVSACLLGVPCRYDGQSKPCPRVLALGDRFDLIPVCPEVAGGLPTPRVPAEIVGDRVLTRDGRDVTDAYRAGADSVLRTILSRGCKTAILKEKSPACGCGTIHNGRFDGGLIPGNGVCASLLLQNGIRVLGETADAIDKL